MNKLLIDDRPIQVLPKLAEEVGLNEAIFLQQLHYWLNSKSAKYIEGHNWIYNTYKNWENNFPFWSNATIRRTIKSCEEQELILVSNFNRKGFDKTKWYSVNYVTIEGLSKRVAQNEQRGCSKRANGVSQNEQTNTIDYHRLPTETTTEDTMSGKPDSLPYSEIINYLNEKADRQFKSTTSKTQSLIRARFNEGWGVDDFKTVIDKKTKEWLGDSKMENFLRPQTLFGTKFESYLNQNMEVVDKDQGGSYAGIEF